jgi:arylformamidase
MQTVGYNLIMFIDLSVELNENTPVYPGDPKVQIEPAGVLEKDGYRDHKITFGTHVGTHIDAPSHMLNGKTLDQFPLEKFMGPAVCIDVTGGFDLEAVKEEGIKEGDIVLFYTGMNAHYHDSKYFEEFPAMPEVVAQYLVEKKINMVGMDMGTPDHEPFPVHKILLAGEVLIIENLTNLDQLVGKKFSVSAMPIKLQLDGAPARVIAGVF